MTFSATILSKIIEYYCFSLSGIKNPRVAVSDAYGKRKYTAPKPAPSILKKKTTESSKPKVEEKSSVKQTNAEEKQKDVKKEDETKTEEKSEKVVIQVQSWFLFINHI
jgi:hypothetical protein